MHTVDKTTIYYRSLWRRSSQIVFSLMQNMSEQRERVNRHFLRFMGPQVNADFYVIVTLLVNS